MLASHARFSWEDDKAASNLVKHEVSFDEASKVFDDANKVECCDAEDSTKTETHFKLIGHSGRRLLVVIDIERDDRKHMISARKVEKHGLETHERQRQS